MAFVRLSGVGNYFLGSGGMSITTLILKENVRDLELYTSFHRFFKCWAVGEIFFQFQISFATFLLADICMEHEICNSSTLTIFFLNWLSFIKIGVGKNIGNSTLKLAISDPTCVCFWEYFVQNVHIISHCIFMQFSQLILEADWKKVGSTFSFVSLSEVWRFHEDSQLPRRFCRRHVAGDVSTKKRCFNVSFVCGLVLCCFCQANNFLELATMAQRFFVGRRTGKWAVSFFFRHRPGCSGRGRPLRLLQWVGRKEDEQLRNLDRSKIGLQMRFVLTIP